MKIVVKSTKTISFDGYNDDSSEGSDVFEEIPKKGAPPLISVQDEEEPEFERSESSKYEVASVASEASEEKMEDDIFESGSENGANKDLEDMLYSGNENMTELMCEE